LYFANHFGWRVRRNHWDTHATAKYTNIDELIPAASMPMHKLRGGSGAVSIGISIKPVEAHAMRGVYR